MLSVYKYMCVPPGHGLMHAPCRLAWRCTPALRSDPMAECVRTLPDSNATSYLPPASSVRAHCPPWVYEEGSHAWNISRSPRCASIDHLRAGYGSYLHHALHGIFHGRDRGRRVVALHHHYVRREMAERLQTSQPPAQLPGPDSVTLPLTLQPHATQVRARLRASRARGAVCVARLAVVLWWAAVVARGARLLCVLTEVLTAC